MNRVQNSSGGRCAAGWLPLIGALVMLTLMVSAVPAAHSEESGGETLERKRKIMDQILSELNLSQEQVEAIENQREQYFRFKEENREQMKVKKQQLCDALDAQQTDPQRIDVLVEEISTLQTERIKSRVSVVLGIKQLLTAEQYSELRERKREMREKHKKLKKNMKDEEEENY